MFLFQHRRLERGVFGHGIPQRQVFSEGLSNDIGFPEHGQAEDP